MHNLSHMQWLIVTVACTLPAISSTYCCWKKIYSVAGNGGGSVCGLKFCVCVCEREREKERERVNTVCPFNVVHCQCAMLLFININEMHKLIYVSLIIYISMSAPSSERQM